MKPDELIGRTFVTLTVEGLPQNFYEMRSYLILDVVETTSEKTTFAILKKNGQVELFAVHGYDNIYLWYKRLRWLD